MTDDELFRLILIGGFVAVLPVGVYHRLKAATSEKLDRRQEGLFLLISIRLLAGVGMLGLLAFMIEPTWMAWSSVPLPAWLRWAGVFTVDAFVNPQIRNSAAWRGFFGGIEWLPDGVGVVLSP